MKNFEKNIFEFWIEIFLFSSFEKIGHRKWKNLEKIDFEIWMEIWKNWNMSRKFEMKKLKFFIFEIWFSFLKF
jgi:hypothetical protein